MRVLIIEDIPTHAALLADIMRPLASEVLIAHTMARAREIIAASNEPPEIITVDLGLPDSDRDNTIQTELARIRAYAPNSLVIVITGLQVEEDEARIRKHADGVWHKHDVVTSKTFMAKLRDLVLLLIAEKGPPSRNLHLLEMVAKSIAQESKLTTT